MTGLHPRSHGASGPHATSDDDADGALLGDGAVTWAEAARARRHHDGRRLGQPARLARDEPRAGLRDVRRAAAGTPRARNWRAGRRPSTDAFLDWLAAHRGRPLRRLPPLHGAARPVHAAGAPTAAAGGRPPPIARRLDPRRRERRSTGARAAARPDEIAHLRARYDGEVARVGRRARRARSPASTRAASPTRTIVVVTADHGEEFQEHGRLTHGSHLYDETIRVPLVHRRARHPGRPARPTPRRASTSSRRSRAPRRRAAAGPRRPRPPRGRREPRARRPRDVERHRARRHAASSSLARAHGALEARRDAGPRPASSSTTWRPTPPSARTGGGPRRGRRAGRAAGRLRGVGAAAAPARAGAMPGSTRSSARSATRNRLESSTASRRYSQPARLKRQ